LQDTAHIKNTPAAAKAAQKPNLKNTNQKKKKKRKCYSEKHGREREREREQALTLKTALPLRPNPPRK
jgi:hypothetical protein